MRRAIPHIILGCMTIGALVAATLSYTTAFADTPRINSTPTASVLTSACPATSGETPTRNVSISSDLVATDTRAYTISGDHPFTLIAPKDGKCQSQTAPLAALKPTMSAGNETLTAALWQGTQAQPAIQVISASGAAAAALACNSSAKATEDLKNYGEPKEMIGQECVPFTSQLKPTLTDNNVQYFASPDVVTQGLYFVAVRYTQGTTPQALLVSCSWNASAGNDINCYDYISSILASNK